MNWIQFNFITPPDLIIYFNCWSCIMLSKKLRKGAWVIWHAVVWIIWKMRNDRVFNNKVCGVDEMVDQVKVIS